MHVHLPKVLADDPDCIQAYCERCKQRVHIRTGDKEAYREFFLRDTLQPHQNLYYKEHPEKMDVVQAPR